MTLTTDNRDKDEMLAYYEARIEALSERVREQERELIGLRMLVSYPARTVIWPAPARAHSS